MDLTCEHNLSPEEMTKALRGLAEAEGISEELSKALRRSSVDLTPKVPADPFARRIYEQMMAAFEKAAADTMIGLGLRKSTAPITVDQIQTLTQAIIDRYGFIAAQLQSDYTPDPMQLERWKRLGLVPADITPETFAASVPAEMRMIRNAFVMGRLADAVEHGTSFEEALRLALSLPLKKPDMAAVAIAEQQTAMYITDNAADLATKIGQLAIKKRNEAIRQMAIDYHAGRLKRTVRDEELKQDEEIPERYAENWQDFASELHHAMEDKTRDWQRVAYTELTDAQRQGAAFSKMNEQGPDTLVYRRPLPSACPHCKHAFLEADGVTPKIFKLFELISNGNNIGRKPMPISGGKVINSTRSDGQETMRPVAGTMHPFCACSPIYTVHGAEHWLTKEQHQEIARHRDKKQENN